MTILLAQALAKWTAQIVTGSFPTICHWLVEQTVPPQTRANLVRTLRQTDQQRLSVYTLLVVHVAAY